MYRTLALLSTRTRLVLFALPIVAVLISIAAPWVKAQELPPPLPPPLPPATLTEVLAGGIVFEEAQGETLPLLPSLTPAAPGTVEGNSAGVAPGVAPDGAVPSLAAEALELINGHRAQAGCAPLVVQPLLTDVALLHSREMAEHKFFGHTSVAGLSPGRRATAAGYQWDRYAENIAAGYSAAFGAAQGWMASDAHRANLLNCAYNETGIGVWYDAGSPYGYYWTHDLAVRRPGSVLPTSTPTPLSQPAATATPTRTPVPPAATPAQIVIPSAYKVRLPIIGGN